MCKIEQEMRSERRLFRVKIYEKSWSSLCMMIWRVMIKKKREFTMKRGRKMLLYFLYELKRFMNYILTVYSMLM